MKNEFDKMENEDIGNEDLEFFKNYFEDKFSDISLPESLKSENLSKKYAKEIEEIKSNSENIENVKPDEKGKVISLFKKRGLAAIAACIAFAGVLYMSSDYMNDNMLLSEQEACEAKPEEMLSAEAPRTTFNAAENSGENRETAPEYEISMDKTADALPAAGANTMLAMPPPEPDFLEMNPSTGAVNIADAAKFLILNGADDYISSEIVSDVIADESDHNKHVRENGVLYNGFLQRLY